MKTELPNLPTDHLDSAFLDDQRQLKLLPAATYRAVDPIELKLWCHRHAIYGLPTLELVEWLKTQIGGRSALEIGAGNARLGAHLGITMTDSCIQWCDPLVRAWYLTQGQVPTSPGGDVLLLPADVAVALHKPQVLVASWFTRLFEAGKDREGITQASIYGAREEPLLNAVETYIHIGNEAQHDQKTLLSRPHQKLKFPWLLSRALNQSTNVIYVWHK